MNGELPIHRVIQNRELLPGNIKQMLKANPTSANVADDQGNIFLNKAFNRGDNDIIEYLIKANSESLKVSDSRGNCALHRACLAGKCNIINCILELSTHGSSARNSERNLPIQLLLYHAECNRDSLEFMGAVHSLFIAYPNVRDIAL